MRQSSESADLQCISCGYQLRGLGGDGKCPECGLNIELSRRGARFDFHPSEPRRVVRLLWALAAVDVVGLFLLLPACGWFVGQAGGNPSIVLHVALVGAVSITRSALVPVLRRQTRGYWLGQEPTPSVWLSRPAAARVAVTLVAVGLVAAQAQVAVCVVAAVLWAVLGGIEAAARLAWMRVVGRALGGPAAEGLTTLARTAQVSLVAFALVGSAGVLGFLSMLTVLMLPLPIAIVAFLCFEFTMFGATVACADVVSEWHAARVNTCES